MRVPATGLFCLVSRRANTVNNLRVCHEIDSIVSVLRSDTSINYTVL